MTEDAYQDELRRAEAGALERERRALTDRRELTLWSFIRGGLTPRRRNARRDAERHDHVDWHEPQLLFLAVTILLLSVTDAVLTLTLIRHGAAEANPLLAFVLEEHPRFFAAAKILLTGAGVLVLVALSRARLFRLIRGSAIMHWCLLGYVALIAYEWWLLGQAV